MQAIKSNSNNFLSVIYKAILRFQFTSDNQFETIIRGAYDKFPDWALLSIVHT